MIDSHKSLQQIYAEPSERALRKEIGFLDSHCRSFIALSPFLVLATSDAQGRSDASPRGGLPGFAKVDGAGRLLIPDASGNNRLDSFRNILATGRAGLLFLIPGFDETLRVNGRAMLSDDPEDLAAVRAHEPTIRLVVCIEVEEAYFHCPKSFLRARLWDPEARVDRSVLPTLGQMVSDQMASRFANDRGPPPSAFGAG